MNNKMPQMYPKDSFDRFGDDLVKLLLSYYLLNNFEEKSLHECVSKQFRRVIYDTISDISIRHEVIVKMRAEDTDLSDEQLCRKLIVFLQKKCPNVQTVCFKHEMTHFRVIPSPYMRPVFEAIHELRNNWPHLKSVDFGYFYYLPTDHQILHYMFTTFGQMVTTFNGNYKNQLPYLTHCLNVSYIRDISIESMFSAEDNQLLVFNRLKKIEIHFSDNTFNINAFKVFISYYKTRLQSLKVGNIDQSIESQPMVTQLLTQLTDFQELRQLELSFDFESDFDSDSLQYSIYSHLKAIGLKLVKLKAFTMYVISDDTALNVEIMSAIQYMPQLKHLDLELKLLNDPQELATHWRQLLQSVKHWPQLTSLSIHIVWGFPLEVMEQIVSTQQTLKALKIATFMHNDKLDIKSLPCISRLSALKSLDLQIGGERKFEFKKCDLKQLLIKCPELRRLYIEGFVPRMESFNLQNIHDLDIESD